MPPARQRMTPAASSPRPALTDLGDMQFLTDDYPEAIASLTRALDLYRGLGDRPGAASALTSLGTVQQATGDSPAADSASGHRGPRCSWLASDSVRLACRMRRRE